MLAHPTSHFRTLFQAIKLPFFSRPSSPCVTRAPSPQQPQSSSSSQQHAASCPQSPEFGAIPASSSSSPAASCPSSPSIISSSVSFSPSLASSPCSPLISGTSTPVCTGPSHMPCLSLACSPVCSSASPFVAKSSTNCLPKGSSLSCSSLHSSCSPCTTTTPTSSCVNNNSSKQGSNTTSNTSNTSASCCNSNVNTCFGMLSDSSSSNISSCCSSSTTTTTTAITTCSSCPSASSCSSSSSSSSTPISSPATPAASFTPMRLGDMYHFGKIIGRGSASTVKQCVRIQDGQMFACKILDKLSEKCRQHSALTVYRRLKQSTQPLVGVIRSEEILESQTKLYIIMEHLSGGDLFDRLEKQNQQHGTAFSEPEAARIFVQIAHGVRALHANGIVHRDLKPENVLFVDQSPDSPIRIADFDLSCACDRPDGLMFDRVGSPGYAAPEVLIGSPYTCAVDIWALGVILYELLSCQMPFDSETDAGAMRLTVTGSYSFHGRVWRHVSESARALITAMLQVDPAKRIRLDELLQHDWAKKYAPTAIEKCVESMANCAVSSKAVACASVACATPTKQG